MWVKLLCGLLLYKFRQHLFVVPFRSVPGQHRHDKLLELRRGLLLDRLSQRLLFMSWGPVSR